MKKSMWVVGSVALLVLSTALACGLSATPAETVVTVVVVVTETPTTLEATATDSGVPVYTAPPEDELTPDLPYAVPVECATPAPGSGDQLFLDDTNGYCLLYPADFTHREESPSADSFFGPPLTPGLEPLMAAMFISTEAANGRSIEQVEDDVRAQYPDLPLTITPATLGGQPAIMVVGEPGRSDSRKLYVVNGDRLYTVTVTPYEQFEETRPYADAVLQKTLDTFWFIGN